MTADTGATLPTSLSIFRLFGKNYGKPVNYLPPITFKDSEKMIKGNSYLTERLESRTGKSLTNIPINVNYLRGR
jgi:hypothetical protein